MGDLFEEFGFDKPLSFSDEGGHGQSPFTQTELQFGQNQLMKKKEEEKKKQGWTNYQTWVNAGINLKFKMPDNFTKYFSDFSKVTVENDKDLPIFILNQFFNIQSGQMQPGKHQDRKKMS